MGNLLNIPVKCKFSAPKPIKPEKLMPDMNGQQMSVASIEWLGKISPLTANVSPYSDERYTFEEIQILHICLTEPNDLYRVAREIFRSIRYPVLLLMQYEEKCLLSSCIFEVGKRNSDQNILRQPALSHWIHADYMSEEAKIFLSHINQQLNMDGSLRDMYLNIHHEIQMFPLGGIKSRQYLTNIVKWIVGSCSLEFLENNFKECTPYKRYVLTSGRVSEKYEKDKSGKNYSYSYDAEDVWYCLMTEETTRNRIINRRYSNLEEIVYRMEYSGI